ncbi:adenosylcobinamide-GDP ribazoletransferase [Nitrospirillum sp. BR 11163]|uniref:adenosylcobinamide-GDP ribazoletransferase n=1 Tax=Nitrospirillum sp. BR 11163 TaxID=3104323 RepID=UPI002AFFCCDC|nr:adenosylcobinamide-GDP ribazoletransferase [Nitrospirillum sp. BR 11163]MEA1675396.1 adenosylcobinamide-GDP ribazoletransferase [Nitrospirillum sp. BR 11163]
MTDATGPRLGGVFAEFIAAVIFLTRLPIRWRGAWPQDLDSRALTWFPIVGTLIGAVGGLVYWGLSSVNVPPLLAALLTVGALMGLTGALHEDGLADVADGFGGGRDRDAKLTIMKDSRVGTYGAAALVLSVAARTLALAAIASPHHVAVALMGAHAYSRAFLPGMKLLLPEARLVGHSAGVGKPNSARALAALLAGFVLAATTLTKLPLDGGMTRLAILAVAAGGVLVVGQLARRQVGGITGDVLGAAEQVVEILFLVAVTGALGGSVAMP